MPITMPKILSCSVLDCAYNINSECHTMAITVGDANHAECDTFYKAGAKGGAADLVGGVGACKVSLCRFNRSFECNAPGINVAPHSGHADCKTFAPVSR